jgi:hypothetical protein
VSIVVDVARYSSIYLKGPKKMKRFKLLYEDEDQLWIRQPEKGVDRFHFIQVIDMVAACGKDNKCHPKYVGELCEVDLDLITQKQKNRALESCGWTPGTDAPLEPAELADRCREYGTKAPLFSVSTNVKRDAYRLCAKESIRLDDPAEHHEIMMGICNGIGNTRIEYMQGDTLSAVARGVSKGDVTASIFAKMYGAKQEEIDQAKGQPVHPVALQMKLGNKELVKSCGEDVLPYATGFMRGLAGAYPDGPRRALAKTYMKGYIRGVETRLGEKELPEWAGGPAET